MLSSPKNTGYQSRNQHSRYLPNSSVGAPRPTPKNALHPKNIATHCTIQIYLNQQWQTLANIECLQPEHGDQAETIAAYELNYAIDYYERTDAAALSHAWPVGVNNLRSPSWPPFLVDLLPQGFGRRELLHHLNLAASTEANADWSLLLAGAANPIGHLRVLEAAEMLKNRAPAQHLDGFSRTDIVTRSEDFLEKIARYGLFITGSTGVQGEWPKLLLTEADDGRYYLDHALPDSAARRHWLVKFNLGNDDQLHQIFRHEAAYMRLAAFLGLRVHGSSELDGKALFIPRFDRSITTAGVQRHAQESIAVLCNYPGFGIKISHNTICRTLITACTDPLSEITEYLKRDIANVALGNTDNHTRNTAVSRNWQGEVRLTPLFDFAPMYLHPDGIARLTRWEQDDDGAPRWRSVLRQIEDATGIKQQVLQQRLIDWRPTLHQLLERMQHEQISADIIDRCRPRILDICQQLEEMSHG